jgi:hypothetical protein
MPSWSPTSLVIVRPSSQQSVRVRGLRERGAPLAPSGPRGSIFAGGLWDPRGLLVL